jgi:hypothetical protein
MVKLSDLIEKEKIIKKTQGIQTSSFRREDDINLNSDYIYGKALQYIEKVMQLAKNSAKFEPNEGIKLIENIVQSPLLLENLYQRALKVRDIKDVFIHHSLNTAIFSIKMGLALNYNE